MKLEIKHPESETLKSIHKKSHNKHIDKNNNTTTITIKPQELKEMVTEAVLAVMNR